MTQKEKAILFEKEAVLRMISTGRDWQAVPQRSLRDAIDHLHVARQLETRLGFHESAAACTVAIQHLEAVVAAGSKGLDALSAAYQKFAANGG